MDNRTDQAPSTETHIYHWVVIQMEFLPQKTITGLQATPLFTDQNLANQAKAYLEAQYHLPATVVTGTINKYMGCRK